MNLSAFIEQFVRLGQAMYLFAIDEKDQFINLAGKKAYSSLTFALEQSCKQNEWFSPGAIKTAIKSIAENMLTQKALNNWLTRYPELTHQKPIKTIGIIMAGNIPLVGFHDLLCVLATGNRAQVKLSSKDACLLPEIIRILSLFNPQIDSTVKFVSKQPEGIEALIATGSNNTARYFESSYQNIPRIIRKNRSSVAILSGNETQKELEGLTFDMLSYFGLGCRNVSKIYVPESYDFNQLISAFTYQEKVLHNLHYINCLNYAHALAAMRKKRYIDNNYVMLQESLQLSTPVGVVHYEFYCNLALLMHQLQKQADNLQCIVTNLLSIENAVPFGKSQSPQLWDYADGIDTMRFLLTIT